MKTHRMTPAQKKMIAEMIAAGGTITYSSYEKIVTARILFKAGLINYTITGKGVTVSFNPLPDL